ncbi:MAG: hypothetical protein F9K29_09205 [Hyphomicrobiaceae bacterium]|nr:MAG: hypothetical protein F9K29_09205 [Hyphomicrobiaceae bacterium]
MPDPLDPLILDMVEWVAREPRSYSEALEVWRTSCPRLTVWEDAIDRGLVERRTGHGGAQMAVTARGRSFLAENGRG